MPDLCKGTDEFLGPLGSTWSIRFAPPMSHSYTRCHTCRVASPDLGRPGASSSDEEAVHLGKIWQVETVFSGLFSNFNNDME